MNYRKIATLFCKGFSIFLFYRFVTQLPIVAQIISLSNNSNLHNTQTGLWVYVLQVIASLIFSILLWIYAQPVGAAMSKGLEEEEIKSQEGKLQEIDYFSLEAVAFSAIGVVILVYGLSSLAQNLVQYWGLRDIYQFGNVTPDNRLYIVLSQITTDVIRTVIGVILVLKSKGVVAGIRALRKA